MTDSEALITRSISAGLTALLEAKSRAIDSECARFLAIGDAEALHDLRVAMRRMHSLFTCFTPCFSNETTLPKRLRAALKSTNGARDLEVMLALLEKLQLELPWLQQQWQKQLEEEYQRLREQLPPAWQALSAELKAPSELFVSSLPEETLGAYAAGLVAEEKKKLLRRSKLLGKKWDEQRAHKLRIHGKRVRYLLEPFVAESEHAATAVNQIKQFQDLLGDYHDIVVLRQKLRTLCRTDTIPNTEQLVRARRCLKKNLRQLRKTFLREYRGKKGKHFHDTLRAAQKSLAQN